MATKTHWLWKLQLLWLALALGAVSAFRLDLLSWRPALLGVAAAAAGLVLTGFCSLLVLFVVLRTGRGGGRPCLAAVALSLPALIGIVLMGLQGAKAPPIHDITTDLDNPPPLTAARALRGPGDNAVEYAGPTVADQQRRAYGDVTPLLVDLSPAEAFDRSLAVVQRLHWRLVAQDRDRGTIEALEQSLFFGFTDDIVIRIGARETGSRIDLRSASRAGISDLGSNVRRIRAFLQAFNASQPK